MGEGKKKSIGIHIQGKSEGNVFENITFVGDMDPLKIEGESKENVFSNITHVSPDALQKTEEPQDGEDSSDDRWYKKPIGLIGLGVLVALISAAALWAIKHYF